MTTLRTANVPTELYNLILQPPKATAQTDTHVVDAKPAKSNMMIMATTKPASRASTIKIASFTRSNIPHQIKIDEILGDTRKIWHVCVCLGKFG